MSWPTVPIGEIAELLNGDRGKNYPSKALRVEHGIPFVNAGHLVDGHIRFEQMDYITEDHFARLGGGKVEDKDILLCIRGSLGRVALAGPGDVPAAIASSLVILRPSPAIDPAFLLSFLSSSAGQSMITARDNGVAQPNVGARDVALLQVPLPPLPTQHKIAAVLSAYDHLIENNRRRIDLLEEMAQRIYREWFVDFRYPGHDSVPFVDSELGQVPENWSLGQVRDIASCVRGRSYRGKDLVDAGGLPFINLKCVERDGGFRPEGVKRYGGPYAPAQAVRTGDIVMAVTDMTQERRIVARAARVPVLDQENGVISMDLVKVVPEDDVPSEYLLGLLRFSSFPDAVKEHANGANVLHLHPDRIGDYRFALPPRAIMEKYARLARALYDEADILSQSQQRLAESRDLLLPRLVSGELDVEHLDIAVGEAAA